MQVGIATRSLNDSEYSGDQCAHWERDNEHILCMIDGLGHGEEAEKAGKGALQFVEEHLSLDFQKLFAGCDSAIRSTRGVAMGIARIEKSSRILHFAGIGNTRSFVSSTDRRQPKTLNSDRGIIGGGFRRLVPDMLQLKTGDTIVMSTDGIAERVDIKGYSLEIVGDAQKLAETILEDWGRTTDDRAVLVMIVD
jgi:phosphoserine phosphatase RsbX